MLRVTREVVTCDVVQSKNVHKAVDKTRRMHYAADQIAYFDECIRLFDLSRCGPGLLDDLPAGSGWDGYV